MFSENRADGSENELPGSPAVVSIKPTQSVVIKQITVVDNSPASFFSIFHDDNGSTFDSTTIILDDSVPDETFIFSDNALMNIAASVGSGGNVTITGYGFLVN